MCVCVLTFHNELFVLDWEVFLMAAEHVLMFPFHRFHSIYSQFRVRFGVSTLEPSGERHRSKSPGPNLSFILFFSLMKISCHLGVEHVPSVQSFGHHIIKFSNIVKNVRSSFPKVLRETEERI